MCSVARRSHSHGSIAARTSQRVCMRRLQTHVRITFEILQIRNVSVFFFFHFPSRNILSAGQERAWNERISQFIFNQRTMVVLVFYLPLGAVSPHFVRD